MKVIIAETTFSILKLYSISVKDAARAIEQVKFLCIIYF